MKICIPKEDSNELRTAISPEVVKKLSGSGHEIFVELMLDQVQTLMMKFSLRLEQRSILITLN